MAARKRKSTEANQTKTNGKQGKSKAKKLRKSFKLNKTKLLRKRKLRDTLTPKKSKRKGKMQNISKNPSKRVIEADSISDCEIIEQVTPLIILDDEVDNAGIEDHPNLPEESSCIVLEDTIINNVPEEDPVAVVEIEDNSLYFIDNVPNARFKTPIYSVGKVNGHRIGPINEPTPVNNHPIEKQIEMSARNVNTNDDSIPSTTRSPKQPWDSIFIETEFQPDPQLSSTQVEIVPNLLDNSINTPECVLTLNSSTNDDNGSVTSVCTVTCNTNQLDSTSPSTSNVEINSTIPIKRKALGKDRSDEPTTKRTKDIVVVDELVSDGDNDDDDDDDDAVVFVSETLYFERPPTIGIQGNRVKKRSNRAEKRSLKLKRQAIQRTNNADSRKAAMQKALAFAATNKNVPKKNKSKKIKNKLKNLCRRFNIDDGASTSQSNNPPPKKNEIDEEEKLFAEKPELFEKRMVVIDGSNVARTFGLRNKAYSIKGIQVCIEHFEKDGFNVKAVVPQMRLKKNLSTDPAALEKLNVAGKVVLTPCKNLPGNRSSSYDDRFILEIAENFDGAIVSNDNYADLLRENPNWDKIIHERVIGFSCIDDRIMFPQDPYGRKGKSLQMILHKRKPIANDSVTKKNTA